MHDGWMVPTVVRGAEGTMGEGVESEESQNQMLFTESDRARHTYKLTQQYVQLKKNGSRP